MKLISSKADNSQEKKSCHAEEDALISELLCDLSAPDRSKSLSDIRTNIIGACSDTNSCGIHPFDTGRLKGDLPADIAEGFYSRCNEDWYKNAGFTDENHGACTGKQRKIYNKQQIGPVDYFPDKETQDEKDDCVYRKEQGNLSNLTGFAEEDKEGIYDSVAHGEEPGDQ